MTIPHGQHKGRAVKGSIQVGETESGNLQIAIDMDVYDTPGQSLGQMTTFLYFSPGAAKYSYERLQALGWKGTGPDDIDKLNDIYDNEVDVRVTQPESYKATDGTTKMGTSKLEILAGAGKVTLSKPLEMSTFKARLKALGGGGSPPTPNGGGGGPAPPF
jgi:hypothetical protein